MPDATGVAEAMLGLPGFRVLEVTETAAELVIRIETVADLVGCPECGVVAVAHDRMEVEYRDLAAFGRPARLAWSKRRWRCEEPACPMKTWTETSPAFSLRCLLTNPRGRRVLSPGRAQRPPREPDGVRARGLLGHRDGGGQGARRAAGGRPGAGR